MAIEFYKQFGDLGYLANYSDHHFSKDGIRYKTVEHYYQSEKYDDPEVKMRIIEASTPKEASNIGRDRNNIRKPNFKNIKNDVMLQGILEKFWQNKDILYKLIETRDEEIVEATINEYYWGIGKDRTGENNIGKILMKAREVLKNRLLKKIITNCGDEVYVLGHKNPDCDSIFSSVLLCNILRSFGINAHFSILDKDYEFSESDAKIINDFLIETPEVISDTTGKKFVLVDHNTLDGLDSKSVVGSFDHHIITNEVEDTLEMEYASTGLLLFDLFSNYYEFSDEEKLLVFLTVLTDTNYLNSTRFSEQDKSIYKKLNLDLDELQFQKSYFATTDFSKDMSSIIKNNLKKYYYDGREINRVLISSYSDDKKNHMEDVVNYLKTLSGEWLLIWSDYEAKNTTVYFDDSEIIFPFFTTSTYEVFKFLDENVGWKNDSFSKNLYFESYEPKGQKVI